LGLKRPPWGPPKPDLMSGLGGQSYGCNFLSFFRSVCYHSIPANTLLTYLSDYTLEYHFVCTYFGLCIALYEFATGCLAGTLFPMRWPQLALAAPRCGGRRIALRVTCLARLSTLRYRSNMSSRLWSATFPPCRRQSHITIRVELTLPKLLG
jgi:hypothetical protein